MTQQNDALTENIIACAFRVSNALGCGFLEKVYENAMVHEARKSGLQVAQQKAVQVLYDGQVVGDYHADLLIENKVIVELKAAKGLDEVNFAQCFNYLKATQLPLCLLINFGTPRIEIKRIANKFGIP